ncbi:predicted protein [Lichtheimia corymbifera JMRC:FSU:9682]|uniref:Uncharacterized protein n=1 Tax=Lichtheimia corymbifera JMRC:FSU:9682 TaxID=1263082 RepID=A0A068RT00_9FUNG|nr:predicted protein [Lichtheimia corymbifera JMRC:FSU:9682]
MEQIEAMEVPKRVRAYCGLLLLVYIENMIILAILQSRELFHHPFYDPHVTSKRPRIDPPPPSEIKKRRSLIQQSEQ